MTEVPSPTEACAAANHAALAEPSVESLGELFSRDPEGYSDKDLDKIITSLREQRQRWEAAAAAGHPAKKKLASAKAESLLHSSQKAGDLGL